MTSNFTSFGCFPLAIYLKTEYSMNLWTLAFYIKKDANVFRHVMSLESRFSNCFDGLFSNFAGRREIEMLYWVPLVSCWCLPSFCAIGKIRRDFSPNPTKGLIWLLNLTWPIDLTATIWPSPCPWVKFVFTANCADYTESMGSETTSAASAACVLLYQPHFGPFKTLCSGPARWRQRAFRFSLSSG